MTISEVSKKFNISTDTLRYYERIGLIPPVPKNKSGLRDYNDDSFGWIGFIKCMRNAGLSIETLTKYVILYHQGDSTINARMDLLVEQREILRRKIEDMNDTLKRLDGKIDYYKKESSNNQKNLK